MAGFFPLPWLPNWDEFFCSIHTTMWPIWAPPSFFLGFLWLFPSLLHYDHSGKITGNGGLHCMWMGWCRFANLQQCKCYFAAIIPPPPPVLPFPLPLALVVGDRGKYHSLSTAMTKSTMEACCWKEAALDFLADPPQTLVTAICRHADIPFSSFLISSLWTSFVKKKIVP